MYTVDIYKQQHNNASFLQTIRVCILAKNNCVWWAWNRRLQDNNNENNHAYIHNIIYDGDTIHNTLSTNMHATNKTIAIHKYVVCVVYSATYSVHFSIK